MLILRWSTISDRLLILGAGRLARSLVERLPAGHEVAVCRRSFFTDVWSGRVVYSTFGNQDRLRQLLKVFQPNQVVICWSPGRGGDHHSTYVGGMKEFLEVASGQGIEQVVYTSSSAVVEGDGGRWVEADGRLPMPTSERSRNLWEAERLLKIWGEKYRVRTLSLRLSGLYGGGVMPGRRLLERGLPINKDPKGWVNLIHLNDAAEAVKVGLQKKIRGEYVVSSSPIERGELYEEASEKYSLPKPVWSPQDSSQGKRLDGKAYQQKTGLSLRWPSPLEWFSEGFEALH